MTKTPPAPLHAEDPILIIGKNSMIGQALCAIAPEWGHPVFSVGSQECDFLDSSAVAKLFATLPAGRTTIVFLSVIKKQVDNSYVSFQNNLKMVRHLMDGARQASVRSIIYCSSIDIFGLDPCLPITEATPTRPDTYYGLAKATAEWLLLESGELECPITALRMPGVFGGPGDQHSVIHRLTQQITAGETIRLSGGGRSLRDYIHVDDVAEVIRRLQKTPFHGRLNVTTGSSLPMREVVDVIGKILGKEPKVELQTAPSPRDFDVTFDNTFLKSLVNHTPRPLPDALKDMLTADKP